MTRTDAAMMPADHAIAATPQPAPESDRAAILRAVAEEVRLHQRMIATARGQRAALLNHDVETLGPLVREMEGLTALIAEREAERCAAVARLMGVPEAAGEQVPFLAICRRFEGEEREHLLRLRDGLRAALDTLRPLNETNGGLIRQALNLTRQWSRLFESNCATTYGATGAYNDRAAMRRAWSA